MEKRILVFTIAAVFSTGVAYAGTNYGGGSKPTGTTFNDFDLNHDGVVSKDEVQQVRNQASEVLNYMDVYNQQRMDQSEFSMFEVPSQQNQAPMEQQDETLGGLEPG